MVDEMGNDEELHTRYGGRYVALRGGHVILSARTFDALSDELDRTATDWTTLLIRYIEPATGVRVY